MSRVVASLALLLLVLLPLESFSPSHAQQNDDTAFQRELNKGKDLFRRQNYVEALNSFERASDLRDGKCAICYAWMAQTLLAGESYNNAIPTADTAVALAAGDIQVLIRAYNVKGLALQALANKTDQDKLQNAEAVFRLALALPNAPPILRYNLGVTLLQEKRDAEGLTELQQYLQAQPKGTYAELARTLIANPRRARESYAPDFSLTTADGERLRLADLRGKVVVLDFWATWCPPCVESVPEIRNLHRRYATNRSLVLIGISGDSDEQRWRDFTNQNRMLWPQYRDEDRKIGDAFDIRAIPTYIVIDHEGIVRYKSTGLSYARAANLEDAIRKQVMLAAKNAGAR